MAATQRASAFASGSRKLSAGSRPWPVSGRPGSEVSVASASPSPSPPRPITLSDCPDSWRRPDDGQDPHLRKSLCRLVADRRDGCLDNDFLDLVEEAHI